MQYTLNVNEGLVIGDDVEVTVLEVNQNLVRLSVTIQSPVPSYEVYTIYLGEDDHPSFNDFPDDDEGEFFEEYDEVVEDQLVPAHYGFSLPLV